MSEGCSPPADPRQFLVISRGQWDPQRTPDEIQAAIDRFYVWHAKLVEEGKMIAGQRLAKESRLVTRTRIVDGPFSEAKEVIGGYWFILADTLDAAAKLAAGNPSLDCGLSYEIRPLEAVRASAFADTTETPARRA